MAKTRVVMVEAPLEWRYAGSICDSSGCWYMYENTRTGQYMNVYSKSGPPALYRAS